jgi:hypothetical protein
VGEQAGGVGQFVDQGQVVGRDRGGVFDALEFGGDGGLLADILRRGIEDGSYPPNRALPSIQTLQQTYGIADGTIQKALAILKAEGLVRTVQERGVFVTSRTLLPCLDAMIQGFRMGKRGRCYTYWDSRRTS